MTYAAQQIGTHLLALGIYPDSLLLAGFGGEGAGYN